MNVWIVDIEYNSWESSMIEGVYSTLEKAVESIKNEARKLGGNITDDSKHKLHYDIQVRTPHGIDWVSFYIKRHTVN